MGAKYFFLLFLNLFSHTLTEAIQPNDTKVDNDSGKGSLVFVFDTTGSMFNDLRQLRNGAEMILKTALEESQVIADFVFVPFHDPGVGPATVTKDKEVFKNALASVNRLYGGGNCPEMSLTGIELALNVSRPHSFLYVFTDATAYDHKLLGKVLDGVQRKQSQVVFVLTGHCNDLDKPTYRVYPQIAAASSGQVFNLNKTSVHKVLEFVRSSLRGRSVNLGSAVNPPGYNYTQEIPVDKSVGEVTVSVSGAKPQIRVINPSGEELTGPPQLVTTLDLSEIMIVKVLKPEPGNWSITVGSEEEHSVKVIGMSNLTFQHGFSVRPPSSMDETTYRPLQGTYNHMLLSVNGTDAPLRVEQVQLLSLDGKPLFEVPLKELDRDRNIYQTDAFVPPDIFFNIAMVGHDENGQEVRRIGSTAVQAKSPDAPYLEVTEKVKARAHTQVKLRCHVESLVPVTAVWSKDGVPVLLDTHALQTTSIEYLIENMSEGYVGTYQCVAKNTAGSSRASTDLEMIVDPPQVIMSPQNLTLNENDELTLSCSVLSEALLHRTQIVFNGTLQNYASDIHLEPTLEGYYTFNKTIPRLRERDSGIYTCVAVNRGGRTNQSAYIKVISKPAAQILGPRTLSKIINSDIKLTCNVENAEKVQWLNINNEVVEEHEINGNYSAILEIKNLTDDGIWTCLAFRNSLKASDNVTLAVLIKPTVTIEYPKNVTILNGTSHELICTVVAKPAPRIAWRTGFEEIAATNVTNPEPNGYKTVLTLDSANKSVNGTYFCVGENTEGSNEDNVTVNVRRKMILIEAFSDTSVELYSQIDFHCSFDSFPSPNITWYHNGTEIQTDNINISEDNTIINVQRVDFEDLGLYVCEADNGYEKMTVNGKLSIHGLENPTTYKEEVKIATQEGKTTIITCRLLKGNPEPNVIWQYRRTAHDNFTRLPENVKINEENSVEIDNVTKINTGIYRCIVSNFIGTDVHDVEVVVQYPPEFKESQETQLEILKEIKVGEKLTLTCDVYGIPPPIITWTKDGYPVTYSSNIFLSDHNSLVIENLTKFDSAIFSCNASSALGYILKNFTVTIFKSPEIVPAASTTAVEVLEGQLVELPCTADGIPTPKLTWLQNGKSISGTRKYIDEYALRFVANLTDFGDYTCLATNDFGSASINYTVLIWVTPSVQPPLEVLEDVLYGTNVNLECNAVGYPIPTIIWKYRDDILNESTADLSFNSSGYLNILNASSGNEGPYTCIAENKAGTALKIFYISVTEAPRVVEDNYTGPYIASVLDTALVVSCNVVGRPRPYIAWIKDGYYLDKDSHYDINSEGTLTIKDLSEDLSGVYTCLAKNSAGNTTKDVSVMIYSVPVVMQEEGTLAVTKALEGTDVDLQCPVRGNDYSLKWYKDGSLITNGTLSFVNVSRTNESTYTCVASNAIGSVYTNVALQVQWAPCFVIQNGENVEVVKGNDYYLDCKTDAKPKAKVKWLFNSKLLLGEDKDMLKLLNTDLRNSGVYKCIASNEHGTRHKQFTLDVWEPPFISEFDLLEVQLMDGANATLECSARGLPTPTISWTFNNTNWIIRNSTLISTNVSSNSQGIYRCEAKNKAGIAHLVYKVLVVSGAKVEDIVLYKDGVGTNVGDTLDLPLSTNARLACKASGSPKPTVQWIRHGNVVGDNNDGINYADLMFDKINTNHAGPYSCIVANDGAIDEKKIKINILEPPRIFQALFQNLNTSQNLVELEVISGQAFYMHCHPFGNPLPEVYWFKDGLPLKFYDDTMVSKEFGEVVVSKSAKHEQSGNYTCVARNNVGETSIVYLVDVLVPPLAQKDNIKEASTLVGKALNLTCPAEGCPMPFVMWIKHPYIEISESSRIHLSNDNYTLIIPNPEVSDSGNYSCIMSNKVGTTELVYDVTVGKPPSIAGHASDDTSEDHVVPLKRSLVLKCQVDGHPKPKITWFKDIQQLSDNLPNIQHVFGNSLVGLWSVSLSDAGQYICVAENGVGTAHRRYNVAVQVPGKWSAWSAWNYCNVTCGLGYQNRSRLCQYIDDKNNTIEKNSQPDRVILDESSCKGLSSEKRKCQMPLCEEKESSSEWSSWSKWSRCSVSCGSGTQARSRRCRDSPCQGDSVQIRKCPGLQNCVIDRRPLLETPEEHLLSKTNTEYVPEATIEMHPETTHKGASIEDDDFFIPTEPTLSFYEVFVTENLDHSFRGPCEPGYKYDAKNKSCLDIDECLIVNNQCHLTQVCANALGGYVCSCPTGYMSLGAGQRCLDINECTLRTHGCEFACVNVAGGYVCACPPHMRLHADKHRCMIPSMYRKPNSYEDMESAEYLGASFEYTRNYPQRTKI